MGSERATTGGRRGKLAAAAALAALFALGATAAALGAGLAPTKRAYWALKVRYCDELGIRRTATVPGKPGEPTVRCAIREPYMNDNDFAVDRTYDRAYAEARGDTATRLHNAAAQWCATHPDLLEGGFADFVRIEPSRSVTRKGGAVR